MIIKRSSDGISSFLTDSVLDVIKKVFQFAAIATLVMFGYLLYGLLSGAFADAAMKPDESRHALQLVNQVSTYLSLGLVITLIAACVLYYEEASSGFVMLAASAVLAYGVQLAIMVLGPDAQHYTSGGPAQAFMHQMFLMAMMAGAPGVLLVLRAMGARFMEARQGEDLSSIKYGAAVQKEEVPRALIPILWQSAGSFRFAGQAYAATAPSFLQKQSAGRSE